MNEGTFVQTGFDPGTPTPRGFTFAGVRCGIKQSRTDLGLLCSETPAVAAGTFTKNRVRAACVERNAGLVPSGTVRAVIVNSGNANAMTGTDGAAANLAVAKGLAGALGVDPSAVLTASTGVIGVPLPTDLVLDGIDPAVQGGGTDPMVFAEAIVTTDTTTKLAHAEVAVAGGTEPIRILGIAKGSGMVHPDMATTLGFVCTDAAVSPTLLQRLVSEAIDDTFNAITVDGDTSTNDMVLVLANGASGTHVESGELVDAFAAALRGVLADLARQVARDGEGATRLIEVQVEGAPDRTIARAVARGICRSSLVKCSAFAGQAEWGRVAMAVGQVALERGFELDPAALRIEAEGICLYDGQGPSLTVKTAELKRRMRGSTVHWRIGLGKGEASYTALGCDLSYDYVRINADEAHQIEVTRTGGVTRNLSLAAYSPRLKHQLLVEGLAYVRRFTGLRAMVYLHPAAGRSTTAASLGHDLELCLDAGLRPLAVVPDARSAEVIADHMAQTGHYVTTVPPDPIAISSYLDRGHLCLMVRESPSPDTIVDLALKLGIQKLIALGNDQGLRDAHGFLQRLSPDTLLAGIQRGRFDPSDPDMLVLARQAAMRGVPAVHVIDARVPHAVVGELFTDQGIGTLVTRQALA
jgi:glutamate N-acetyltransferase/amino-acid acetyltransferase